MKHAAILVLVMILAYIGWQFASRSDRARGIDFLSRHGLRLYLVIFVVLLLLAIAYNTTATKVL